MAVAAIVMETAASETMVMRMAVFIFVGFVRARVTSVATAATMPIGSATNFSNQGEESLSDFHNASGGEVR